MHLLKKNSNRYDKKLWSELGQGEKIGLFVAQNERHKKRHLSQSKSASKLLPLIITMTLSFSIGLMPSRALLKIFSLPIESLIPLLADFPFTIEEK